MLAPYPWLAHDATRLRKEHGNGGWHLSRDLRAVRVLRASHSRRQLLERTVELWTDRLNVPFSAQDANYLRPVFDRDVVRAHALGRFPELLAASSKSPAMLAYLDADSSIAGAPNENYARELMELHSLGSDGGYTENDVRELARCLTGWGYVRHTEEGPFGAFRFDPRAHDSEAKHVLGIAIPAGGGIEEGELIVAHLGRHPSTARSVANALVRHFIAYEPPPALVDSLQKEYLRTRGDLCALLRLTLSPESLALARPKVKRPFEFAVSLLRAMRAPIRKPEGAASAIEGLGQQPCAWPTPDGYPDDAETWSAQMYSRWRFAAAVATGWNGWCGLDLEDLRALVDGAPRETWPARVALRLLGDGRASLIEDELAAYLGAAAPPRDTDLSEVFELAASCPAFQLY
jgi:uncharacterized protein (DUF1800 family)